MATRASSVGAAPNLKPGGFDPLRWAWDLLTNVKFALLLVGLAGVAGMVGIVLPQVPQPMRGNPAARQAWLELQREDFGRFTGLMDRLDLFDVFHAPWFYALWILIIVAVTVCTVSRFRPTARGVHRPLKTVSERYFETAHHRADFSHPGGVDAVEAALRKRRYAVERTREADGAVYLFAERFQWAAYGTFVSHLALLLLLVGGLLTFFAGFDRTMVLAEGMPGAAVFTNPGPGQLFVKVNDAYRGIDDNGNIIDYHSMIEVTRGDETIACKTTVNDPCQAFGYKVHQAAFFNDIARLRIEGPDGRLLYSDVVDFENNTTSVPQLRVRDASGAVLFDQPVPQMQTDPGPTDSREDDVALAGVTVPQRAGEATATVSYALSWRLVERELRLVIAGPDGAPRQLREGDEIELGGQRIAFVKAAEIPALDIADMPGTPDGRAVVQMPTTTDGQPYLFVTGVDDQNVVLTAGQPQQTSRGYTYTFEGQIEASGLSVKRDPGHMFIWLAVGLSMVGLGITFYVPRRRLWVKVTPARTYFAGIAERTTRLGREVRLMGAELGSRDALRAEDRDQ